MSAVTQITRSNCLLLQPPFSERDKQKNKVNLPTEMQCWDGVTSAPLNSILRQKNQHSSVLVCTKNTWAQMPSGSSACVRVNVQHKCVPNGCKLSLGDMACRCADSAVNKTRSKGFGRQLVNYLQL